MLEEAQCIFDKNQVKGKIKGIIKVLTDAKTELQIKIDEYEKEKATHQQANAKLQSEKKVLENQITVLTTGNKNINEELKVLIDNLKNELEAQKTTSENELEAQKTTSNENMNKIISTLVSERNRLLEESKKEQEEAKEKQQAAALADAQAQEEALQAALTKCNQEKEEALQAALTKCNQEKAELQEALTKCNQEKEELKQDAQSKTESMKNIEKIQDLTKLSMEDIQSELWNTAKKYMEEQFENPDYKATITSDPFVQVELKTLLNDDTEVTEYVTSEKIKEAHNKVIKRHYKTIYPNTNNLEVPKDTDHIVIPPYLYLSLTHFYTIFSFLETRKFHMRFLNQDMDHPPLEPGFHIIIKKLGDGDQDFFSRVDVKFVLLETETTAKDVIGKIFKESTFYGHIPTQTILQDVLKRGGNKTLKNNKRRLKKRRKYTQSNRRK